MIVTIRINEHTFPMPMEEAERLFGEYHQNIQDRYNFDFLATSIIQQHTACLK